MDSQNLATVFGPNILHCLRPSLSEKQLLAECAEQAEQSAEVIGVTKDLIDHHVELFELSAAQHDEVLRLMMEADRENMEIVLRRLSNEQVDADVDTNSTNMGTAETLWLAEPLQRGVAGSDADLLSLVQQRRQEAGMNQHQPLRVCRSADPWTEGDKSARPPEDGLRVPSVDATSEPCSSPRRRRPVSSTTAMTAHRQEGAERAGDTSIIGSMGLRRWSRDIAVTAGSAARPLCRQGAVRERPCSDSAPVADWDHLTPPQVRPAHSRQGANDGSSSGGTGGRRGDVISSPGGECRGSSQQEGGSVFPPSTSRHSSLRDSPLVAYVSKPRVEREPIRKDGTASSTSSSAVSAMRRERREQRESERRLREEEKREKEKEQQGGGEGEGGERQWQKERWGHWQQLSMDKLLDSEQETLV